VPAVCVYAPAVKALVATATVPPTPEIFTPGWV
jgi:hypothetical protein